MQASGYVPPPVRAPGSGAPSYWETMTVTLFEVAGVPLRVHGAPTFASSLRRRCSASGRSAAQQRSAQAQRSACSARARAGAHSRAGSGCPLALPRRVSRCAARRAQPSSPSSSRSRPSWVRAPRRVVGASRTGAARCTRRAALTHIPPLRPPLLRAGLFYYGFSFAVLTFMLDGPILFGARPRCAPAAPVQCAHASDALIDRARSLCSYPRAGALRRGAALRRGDHAHLAVVRRSAACAQAAWRAHATASRLEPGCRAALTPHRPAGRWAA